MKINNELRECRGRFRLKKNAKNFHKFIYGSSMLFYFISNGTDMRGSVKNYRRKYYRYEE